MNPIQDRNSELIDERFEETRKNTESKELYNTIISWIESFNKTLNLLNYLHSVNHNADRVRSHVD